MVRVKASLDIQADPEAVFSLVTDVARKARLGPHAAVIGVSKETAGPVGVGTVFHYCLSIEGKIADYRTRCVAFEPGRMMETVSDTRPPFKVRVTVEPVPGGARLTQEETFSLPVLHMPVPGTKGWWGRVLHFIFGDADAIVQSRESSAAEDVAMQAKLEPKLADWLERIKTHLEREQSRLET